MGSATRILAFSGSTRKDSVNKKLARFAARVAEGDGVEATFVDLRDLPMPLYDGDLEAESGIPENAKKFKELLKNHHGLIIACPEYNSSMSAVLKNAIDWASRPEEGEERLAAFAGKTAAIMSASPGALGGMRALVHLRAMLENIQVMVIPDQTSIPKAFEVFADDGTIGDSRQSEKVSAIVTKLIDVTSRLNS